MGYYIRGILVFIMVLPSASMAESWFKVGSIGDINAFIDVHSIGKVNSNEVVAIRKVENRASKESNYALTHFECKSRKYKDLDRAETWPGDPDAENLPTVIDLWRETWSDYVKGYLALGEDWTEAKYDTIANLFWQAACFKKIETDIN